MPGGPSLELRQWVASIALPLAASLCVAALGQGKEPPPRLKGSDSVIVRPGDLQPPRVAAPCMPGHCPFAGQRVTVLVVDDLAISTPLLELKAEFEAATGATLDVVRKPYGELFSTLLADLTSGSGKYDACIAGAWWWASWSKAIT